MKRTNWTSDLPLDPPDDGLDDDEREARDRNVAIGLEHRMDEMRDRDLRSEIRASKPKGE
jgi:hypothetical protein